jgi:hypothetical protein
MGVLKSVFLRRSKWILVGCAAIATTRFYYVREMIAALILFTLLFGCIAAVVLLLFIFDWVGEAMLGFFESHAKDVLRYARHSRAVSESRYT